MDEQKSKKQEGQSKFKEWMQDNLRIIISILIVVAIAGGIYSYSQRTEVPEEIALEEEVIEIENEEGEIMEEEAIEGEEVMPEESKEMPMVQEEDRTSSVATSQETGEAFQESATTGDGVTHLARRALAHYLEKSPDSALTAEHKIYIEDYLKDMYRSQGPVYVGTTISFQKNDIQRAIDQSKNLTEKQLENLKKYSVRVSSLS